MDTKFNKRELIRMIALIAVVWVAIVIGISRWQQSRPAGARAEPRLIHYPGTEQAPEQTGANLGLHKYWFRLNEPYPSKSVYYFYQNQLEPHGWRQLGTGEPKWVRVVETGSPRDLFEAVWLSPDNLFAVQLQMMSVVKQTTDGSALAREEREPGIKVFVTLQRAIAPGLMLQEQPKTPPGDDIKPPE